ncbi:MAG: single-stranded DNA-binding protein [Ruminococcus sp.]|nr:single-stranded DNA-binding protein [Ruminococcus sp.]
MHNHVILSGRLTDDPEIRQTPSGVYVCPFTLAVQRVFDRKKRERETDFIYVEAWRSTAEFIARNFHKGELIDITGRLKVSRLKDGENNVRYKTVVIAESVDFAPTNNRKAEKKSDKYGQGEDISDFEEIVGDGLPF